MPTLRAGHCYGTRIYYIDKETWHSIGDDLWDPQEKYWKANNYMFAPQAIPGTSDSYFETSAAGTTMNFQGYHGGYTVFSHTTLNQNAGKYNDVTRYGTPAGLQQIMQ